MSDSTDQGTDDASADPHTALGADAAAEQERERARERLRAWYTTPSAVEEELLDTRQRSRYWATRSFLLRSWLQEKADSGDETAKAALELDAQCMTGIGSLPRRSVELFATALAEVRLGRRVRVTRTDGSAVEGVMSSVDGLRRDAVVTFDTAAGPVQVPAADVTGYVFT